MKLITSLLIISLIAVYGYSALQTTTDSSTTQISTQPTAEHGSFDHVRKTRFTISGMHCDSCSGGLTSELSRVDGVMSATVSLKHHIAAVTFNTNLTSQPALLQVIDEAGFSGKILSE